MLPPSPSQRCNWKSNKGRRPRRSPPGSRTSKPPSTRQRVATASALRALLNKAANTRGKRSLLTKEQGPSCRLGCRSLQHCCEHLASSALLEVLRILVLVTSPLPAVPSCSPNPGAFPRCCSASGAVPSLVPGMLTIAAKLCSVLKPSSAPTCPAPPHSTRGSRGSRGGFALPRAASSKGRASRGPDPAQNTEQLQPRHCCIPEALPTALCTVLLFLVAAA